MYLDQYLKIAKNNFLFIATLVVIGAVCGYISTAHIASGYKAQQTVFIKIEKIDPMSQDIDPQTTTDTVVAYISDNNYQRSINSNIAVSAKKIAAQVVTLQATSLEPTNSQSAIENTIQNFNSAAKKIIENANIELTQIGTPAPPTKNVLNSRALSLFGALIGLASSIIIISTSRYFRL